MTAGGEVDLSSILRGGVAIVVATVGADGSPAITRGWGPAYNPSSNHLALNITAPAGSPTLANLEANGAIAVTISEPLTYKTVQLKGTVAHIGAPSEDDRARAHEHVDRFVAEVAQLGLTSGVDGFFLGDLRLVDLPITQMFLQTPGANAGSQLS